MCFIVYLIISVIVAYILNFTVFGLFLIIIYSVVILLLYFYSSFSRVVYLTNINICGRLLFLILLVLSVFKNIFIKNFNYSTSVDVNDLLNKYIFFHGGLFTYSLFHYYFWYLILFIILLLVFIFLIISVVSKNKCS